ncbi:MAG: hypothetical protein JRH19_27765 [Deltaproteobacteria bacterium]|nr:hypothetical protein [Deltaproteobacteria bacterium]
MKYTAWSSGCKSWYLSEAGSIVLFDIQGNVQTPFTTLSGISSIEDIEFDSDQDLLALVQEEDPQDMGAYFGRVVEIDRTLGTQAPVNAVDFGGGSAERLAVEADGTLLVAEFEGRITRIDRDTGDQIGFVSVGGILEVQDMVVVPEPSGTLSGSCALGVLLWLRQVRQPRERRSA